MRWTDNWMPESADVVGITYYYHHYEYHRFEFQCANLIFRVFFSFSLLTDAHLSRFQNHPLT